MRLKIIACLRYNIISRTLLLQQLDVPVIDIDIFLFGLEIDAQWRHWHYGRITTNLQYRGQKPLLSIFRLGILGRTKIMVAMCRPILCLIILLPQTFSNYFVSIILASFNRRKKIPPNIFDPLFIEREIHFTIQE